LKLLSMEQMLAFLNIKKETKYKSKSFKK